MSILKRPSRAALMALLVLIGFVSVLGGVYLLAGLAVTLIVGGAAVVAFGLLVDV